MKKHLAVLLAAYCLGAPAVAARAADVCAQVYIPVCGVNGVTYSNDCFAALAGIAVAHTGECGAADLDSDGDGVKDLYDNCPTVANANQLDRDGDGLGDACDPQTCGNGIAEAPETCDDGNSDNWDSCSNTCTVNQTYTAVIDTATSVIHTSGGFTGGGMGDVQPQGSFQYTLAGDQVRFSNVSVSTTPWSDFVFPTYSGSYSAIASTFYGAMSPNSYSGALSNGQLTLLGYYQGSGADRYQYNFTINATATLNSAPPPVVNTDVMDAPHNSTFGISCRDCHTYALWWQYSPMSATDPNYAARTRTICLTCHGPGGSSLPAGRHGSTVSGSTYGTWETDCRQCHDSHFQAQLDWRGTVPDSDLYLVTGTIGAASTIHSASGATTLDYTTGSAAAGWTDPATWNSKNGPGRGLLLVLDTSQAQNTFQVLAADATTITVKGTFDPSFGGRSFGLIYGQQINSTITTPAGSREVKFFNPKGNFGFTNSETPATGICQVCHTQTTGSDTNHWGTAVCSSCHTMAGGFASPAP